MFPSRYGSRLVQDRASSSSASSSRHQQSLPGGATGYSNRTAYRDAPEYESELGHLLVPPSPPSLDQVLSAIACTSDYQRPSPIPSPSRSHQLYDHIERELLSDHSGSSQQPHADAIPTLNSNSRYQNIYNDFAQALSVAPESSNSGSRRQSAASRSTRSFPGPNHYRGVCYYRKTGKWNARWTDPALGRRVSLGYHDTQSEAIMAIDNYRATRQAQMPDHPGVYRVSTGRWEAKYITRGERMHVGTFGTMEEAEIALNEHRAARGLSPMRGRRRL